jgi:hypothetical protein
LEPLDKLKIVLKATIKERMRHLPTRIARKLAFSVTETLKAQVKILEWSGLRLILASEMLSLSLMKL